MQIQDLDPTKKLPYIRSSNKKIIALLSFVLLLVAINIFVVFYGKSNNSAIQSENKVVQTAGDSTEDVTQPVDDFAPAQVQDKNAEKTLTDFLELIKAKKIAEAQEYISEYTSRVEFEEVLNEGVNYGETISYKILSTKFSSQGNYSYITIEFMSKNATQYQKYTLIKINSSWKLVEVEIL